jgi:hypothetical protein
MQGLKKEAEGNGGSSLGWALPEELPLSGIITSKWVCALASEIGGTLRCWNLGTAIWPATALT